MEDFDFIAEHPKADMSKVNVIRVNGKEYLAADRVLEIIKNYQGKCDYGMNPAKAIYCDITALKGGDKE